MGICVHICIYAICNLKNYIYIYICVCVCVCVCVYEVMYVCQCACGVKVCVFKLHSCCYVYFLTNTVGKSMSPFIK